MEEKGTHLREKREREEEKTSGETMHTDKKRKLTDRKGGGESEKRGVMASGAGIFQGCRIFLLETGIGKARCNLFIKQIIKHGGEIAEKISDTASHLVVDEKMEVDRLCRILNIKNPKEDFEGINVVKSLWISSCLKEGKIIPVDNYLVYEPTLPQSPVGASSVTHIQGDKEYIVSTDVSENVPGPSVTYHVGAIKSDHGNVSSDYASSDEEDTKSQLSVLDLPSTRKLLPKGSWACAKASSSAQVNHNKEVTDKLQALAKIYENTNDRWRALGYSKAIAALKRHPKKITTFEEAKALTGVGEKLAAKIWEIIESGGLRKLDEISSSSEIQAINLFTNIWGVGATTARQWVSLGYRTLEDIREKAHLNRQQKIGLKYYEELLERIPRDEAAEIEATVKQAAAEINPGLVCVACGSYRRGKATCGDVDVLITHPDGKSHVGVFTKVLDNLHRSGFLTDDLARHEDEGSQKKYLGVCLLPGEGRKHRRLDVIVVPYAEYACALLYFTGSAHFNRSMRHLAGKMNMSLSEHSLNSHVVRASRGGEKLNTGTPLNTPTEEDVFRHLGLKYRPPEERDH